MLASSLAEIQTKYLQNMCHMDYCCINIFIVKKYEGSKELSAYRDVTVLQNLLHALTQFNHNQIFTLYLWEHFSNTTYVSLQLNIEFGKCVMI
jgi:hypothetical protein